MSVINQMLKDLGERQSRSELRLEDMLDRQQTGPMKLARNYRKAAGPSLMVLAGALVLGFLWWQQSQRDASKGPVVQTAQAGTGVVSAAVVHNTEVAPHPQAARNTTGTEPAVTAAAPAKREASASVQTAGKRKPAPAKRAPAGQDSTAAKGAGKIQITRSVTPLRQAETWYRDGLEKLQADRIGAAISDLRKAVGLQPDMHAARELLAALLLRSGHSAEAHELLQQGMRLNPGHTAYARLYAQSLIEAGDPAGALQVLTVSEPYAAQQADYRAFMAAVAQRLARHEDSVRHYMAALDQQPARGAWWVGMAISLEALGRAQEAARAYRTALAGSELNADLMNYARARAAQLSETSRGG